MCTPFRVSISPLFSNTGYRFRARFLKPVAKEEILQEWGCYLLFGVYFSRFFLEPGEKIFSRSAHTNTMLGIYSILLVGSISLILISKAGPGMRTCFFRGMHSKEGDPS